jgi:hypothetical protein
MEPVFRGRAPRRSRGEAPITLAQQRKADGGTKEGGIEGSQIEFGEEGERRSWGMEESNGQRGLKSD